MRLRRHKRLGHVEALRLLLLCWLLLLHLPRVAADVWHLPSWRLLGEGLLRVRLLTVGARVAAWGCRGVALRVWLRHGSTIGWWRAVLTLPIALLRAKRRGLHVVMC